MERGELDVAIGCRCKGDHGGLALWSEPLVWASGGRTNAENLSRVPLAVFPDPCPYRDAALAALAKPSRECRIASVSPSLGGLAATAAAGLGVTPLTASSLTPALRVVGPDYSALPPLPNVDFVAHIRPTLPLVFEALSKSVIKWIVSRRGALKTTKPRA